MRTEILSITEQFLKREEIEEDEVKQILTRFRKEIPVHKQNVEDSYREFLRSDLFQDENYKQLNRKGEIYKEDIPALIYLSFLLDKPDIKTRYDHIFVDEGRI